MGTKNYISHECCRLECMTSLCVYVSGMNASKKVKAYVFYICTSDVALVLLLNKNMNTHGANHFPCRNVAVCSI